MRHTTPHREQSAQLRTRGPRSTRFVAFGEEYAGRSATCPTSTAASWRHHFRPTKAFNGPSEAGGLGQARPTGAARNLDTTPQKVHNCGVGSTRLNIPDARRRGSTLRVTRQPGQRNVVFSHWRDGRCIASTPIELAEVPGLIGVLVDALGVAVDMGNRPSIVPTSRPRVVSAMQRWVHPRLAQVTELRSLREHKNAERTG
jgi:hypothetical protein